jgi:hypothetical protein
MAAVARLHVAVFGEAATDGEAGPAAADAPSPSRTLSAGASAGGKVCHIMDDPDTNNSSAFCRVPSTHRSQIHHSFPWDRS